jgi:predicted DNA-binding transcriptional regulator YafY
MRRADRLFDIIQQLRSATGPVTAAAIAVTQEVTPRTIYRDIATLQARRVPIEGAPGIGYMLRRGYDLPPLAFTVDEIEAIAVGVRLLPRTGDATLEQAAARVLSKLVAALPEAQHGWLVSPPIHVSDYGAAPRATDPAPIRAAMREGRKLQLHYRDAAGMMSERTVWPVAVAYCAAATLLAAWCELRCDFRHFRLDRIDRATCLGDPVPLPASLLMARWRAQALHVAPASA